MKLTSVQYFTSAPTDLATMVMLDMAGMLACIVKTLADMGVTGMNGKSATTQSGQTMNRPMIAPMMSRSQLIDVKAMPLISMPMTMRDSGVARFPT